MPVKIIGADKVAAQFAKLGKINNANFINVISQSTLSLLRNNCPVDTGELQRSWTEIYKTNTSVGIGTNDSQVIKLKSILSGTQYSAPNDFVTPIANIIADNIEAFMLTHLKRSHPYLSNIRGGSVRVPTASHIPGLTGLKHSKRFGRGSSKIYRKGSGQKKLFKRISGFKRVV